MLKKQPKKAAPKKAPPKKGRGGRNRRSSDDEDEEDDESLLSDEGVQLNSDEDDLGSGLDLKAIIPTRGRPKRAATTKTIERMRHVITKDDEEDESIPDRSSESEDSNVESGESESGDGDQEENDAVAPLPSKKRSRAEMEKQSSKPRKSGLINLVDDSQSHGTQNADVNISSDDMEIVVPERRTTSLHRLKRKKESSGVEAVTLFDDEDDEVTDEKQQKSLGKNGTNAKEKGKAKSNDASNSKREGSDLVREVLDACEQRASQLKERLFERHLTSSLLNAKEDHMDESGDTTWLGQPKAIQGTMGAHQLVAINWLWALYELGLGAILADEMGLGIYA